MAFSPAARPSTTYGRSSRNSSSWSEKKAQRWCRCASFRIEAAIRDSFDCVLIVPLRDRSNRTYLNTYKREGLSLRLDLASLAKFLQHLLRRYVEGVVLDNAADENGGMSAHDIEDDDA